MKALLPFLFLCSCTVNPFVVEKPSKSGGVVTIVSTGGSLFTRADYEDGKVTHNGTVIEYKRTKKNEIELPKMKFNTEMLGKGIDVIKQPLNNASKALLP